MAPKGQFKYREGHRFKNLTFIQRVPVEGGKTRFLCRCDCGRDLLLSSCSAVLGYGCRECAKKNREEHAKSFVGYKTGKLKVIKYLGIYVNPERKDQHAHPHYLVKCKCGKKIIRNMNELHPNKSCGCLYRDMLLEGKFLKGEKNVRAKYTNDEVNVIRKFYNTGLYSIQDLCIMMNTNSTEIRRLLKGDSWKIAVHSELPKRELIYCAGKKIGNWTILEKDNLFSRKNRRYICKCDCGHMQSILCSGVTLKRQAICQKCNSKKYEAHQKQWKKRNERI